MPIHIGFYSDDSVSLTFFDKTHNAYPVITQPPVLGKPTWRVTETVTFVPGRPLPAARSSTPRSPTVPRWK